jgi:hypothetical protein
MWQLDSYPLAEEIGNPDLFVGREQEMKRLLKWAQGTKPRNSKSTAILSRRKKGKTALLQRFYNVLYHRNDPRLIPFYYRIPETVQTKSDFTETFYRRILTQYFACTTRTPKWVGTILRLDELKDLAASDQDLADDIRRMEEMLTRAPTAAWPYVQETAHRISQVKDVRILQILDEFQYMNKYIVADDDPERIELLCHSYMGAAESKYSPQIVAGSYIGWLEAILGHLTSRYSQWYLEGLDDEEALAAVYNYASVFEVPITDRAAPYVAEICDNDPFYIASTVRERIEEKNLTTEEGVRDALTLEVTAGKGAIARMWSEYLSAAFPRLNGRDARRIVLYLAKHEPEERSRRQIREDLGLDMPENELENKLHQLVEADILANGSSDFRFRGLGDRIFAMVFRRIYGAEIDDMSVSEIEDDFKKELATARRASNGAAEQQTMTSSGVMLPRGFMCCAFLCQQAPRRQGVEAQVAADESEAMDIVLVAGERLHLPARVHRPQHHAVVPAAGGHVVPIGGEGHAEDFAVVAPEHLQARPRRHLS